MKSRLYLMPAAGNDAEKLRELERERGGVSLSNRITPELAERWEEPDERSREPGLLYAWCGRSAMFGAKEFSREHGRDGGCAGLRAPLPSKSPTLCAPALFSGRPVMSTAHPNAGMPAARDGGTSKTYPAS